MITRAHILAGIGLFLAGCLVGREWRDRSADLAESRNQSEQYLGMVKAEQQARATEHQQADTLATIGAKHEEDREAAEAVPAAVVADLRAGNVRLTNASPAPMGQITVGAGGDVTINGVGSAFTVVHLGGAGFYAAEG